MLEQIKYVNHIGETLEFGTFPLFVNQSDLRDFAWEITSKNDKIASFRKGIVTKKLPVIVKCETEAEGLAIRDNIFEVAERDVLAMKHGTLMVGDYYLKCYITGSKKNDYLTNGSYMVLELTVQTDFPQWVKETTTPYGLTADGESAFLDYPIQYLHDYMNVQVNGYINNTNFVASNFRMVIHGEIINPTIHIGGHMYNVDVEVGAEERLIIDSVEKNIVLVDKNGKVLKNCFNLRNRESYIFEKIPVGESLFICQNPYIRFDITLLDERSEPKWI